MKAKCNRCKKVFNSNFQFDQHKCKGNRNLRNMPIDLLEKIARGKMNEDEAWKIAIERKESFQVNYFV